MSVTVYSKPSCVQCNATYRALTKKGIDYTVVDVTEDTTAYEHVVGLGYQQVPVVEAGGEHWSGFRPDKINTLALLRTA
ncbi:NrdH-redoxin [Kocuria varians]|uniref:Glutaredoxin-like protein NrdH n=1 Tax=Kocuria varians TaxID=1272 RepID=A0A4Y4D2R2_KOCVA|nr:glutaredoxin-like protein NrdH [Kocuria varians]GEC98652.1 NrdH-redoxin [Kocuria varians]